MPARFLPHVISDTATTVAKLTAQRLRYVEADVRVLMAIGAAQNTMATSLAGMTRMSKVEVSRTVTRLTNTALVSRRKHPRDGRATLLRLTAKGTRALASITKQSADLQRELLAVLTPEEAVVFWTAMEKLYAVARSLEPR